MRQHSFSNITAHSDDGSVAATATPYQEVVHVRIEQTVTAEQAESGIVQAVNRALDGPGYVATDDLEAKRRERVSEFDEVLEGLNNDVAQTRTSMRH